MQQEKRIHMCEWDNKVEYKEVIELFLEKTIYEIKDEDETPRINFIFEEDAYDYFYHTMENPYRVEGWWIPDITEKDIDTLRHLNEDALCPTIIVKDYQKFFNYLTEITNEQAHLYSMYGEKHSARALCIMLMRRIWLRMGPTDFLEVEHFLKQQLDFLKNRELDHLREKPEKIGEFHQNDVSVQIKINRTWDETTRAATFWIETKDFKTHNLPQIYYDIRIENNRKVCYIYAVQNDINKGRVPKIERLLYKLNKFIEEENVHPGKLYAMKAYLKLLKRCGIYRIKIPILQVLNYRYHELLSERVEEEFHTTWTKERIESHQWLPEYRLQKEMKRYEADRLRYNRFVGKQDLISQLKTENLINLLMECTNHDPSLQLRNDLDNNTGYLEFQYVKNK